MIEQYDGFIFGIDGTIYRGENIIPNADKTVNFIKASGKKSYSYQTKPQEA
ncbi:MAG: hypothetical protein O6940_00205 [Ignavibacteria bacterium]|nr:hypothetical protein [Ignavibacteria bacterium]